MKNLKVIGYAIDLAIVVLIVGLMVMLTGCGARTCPRCGGTNIKKIDTSDYYGSEFKCYDCGLWWWANQHGDFIVRY